MAPFSLMTASVQLLARSLSVFSGTSLLSRVLPAAYTNPVKSLSSQVSSPPKRPLNGYMRYVIQQMSVVSRLNPEVKKTDVMKKIGQQWSSMSPEQKRPFQEAFLQEKEQFSITLQKYKAQLTPAEIQQQALEDSQRKAKRKAHRRKQELRNLGKPKRPRTSFNIYLQEKAEGTSGIFSSNNMKNLSQNWKNLLSHQKKAYIELAEDEKIRYKNEMKLWEDQMAKIGRLDLIRDKSLSAYREPSTKAAAKSVKATKPKQKEVTVTAQSETTRKTTKQQGSAATQLRTPKKIV
ncbi:transcription factor A, mitochondrial [Aulostomus maculatus]